MQHAKAALDVGLYTNRAAALRRFYERLGCVFDEDLAVGRGVMQHRYRLGAGVLKINESRAELSDAPTGYRGLSVGGEGGVDPDGLALDASGQVVITVASRDPDAHGRFYVEGLGAAVVGAASYRVGETGVRVVHDPAVERAGALVARGFRYITVQVFDVVAEHDRLLKLGFEEGMAPLKLGDVAAISFVRDPGGNWVEVSQRASLTGALPDRV